MSENIEQDSGGDEDRTGQTLGDFRILRRIGQGGMGQVYLAEQISLKRKVALKLLRADLADNANSLQRFKSEAEAVARATHANIVQVYAIGEADGLHYMALEYVQGRNLHEYVEKKGPPELMVALSILRQTASALHRASELGVIHRDIKPENILLTRKGEVKVADFGLSRIYAEGVAPLNLTQSGVSLGTPLYMSPEQVEGGTVDARTDIYSLGVTCYHMFAGHPPYRGSSPFEVALQHVKNDPKPLSEIRPDLPPDLCAMVHKMMAKNPDDRFQTAREIVAAVADLRDRTVGLTTSGVPALGGMTMDMNTGERKPAASTQEFVPAGRFRWRWLVVASLAVAFGVGLFLGFLRYQDQYRAAGASDAPTGKLAPPVPPITSKRERERFLIKLVDENIKTQRMPELMIGLKYSTELGLLYLKDRRFKQASELFDKLEAAAQKKGDKRRQHPYIALAQLGDGIIAAFRNMPTESLKLFKVVLAKTDAKNRMALVWRDSPELREMIAEAMHFNFANAPEEVRQSGLARYRFPPGEMFRDRWDAK